MSALLARFSPHALAASLVVGLAAANVVRGSHAVIAACAVAAAVAAAFGPPQRLLVLFAAALALGGWWWGSVRLDALDRSVLVAYVGESAYSRVAVTGPARRTRFALRLPAEMRRFGRVPVRESVLLELPLGRSPPQGAFLDLVTRVELPREADSGFDERTWLKRRGVHVVLDGGRWRVVGRRGGILGFGDRLRAHIGETLARGLDGERRAILAGIVLGEDEGLSDELRESFRASGLYHLLAVSGQNIAFIAGGVLLVAWLVGASRLLAEVGILAAIAGYVLAVGWQPSVVRAGVAGALASLAWLASRPRDRWYFLLVGAIVLLAWNPYTLLEPGFQLSFAAVASIFVAVPLLRRRLDGYPVPAALADVVAVSTACGLATAPVLLLHFGTVPVFSVLANALAVVVVGPLLGMGLIAAAVAPVAPAAAATTAWLAGWLAAYLAGVARVVGGLPFAEVSTRTVVAVTAAIAAATWAVKRVSPRARRRAAVFAAAPLLVLVAWRLWPEPGLPPPRGLRISFLDVGQGDAVLLQVPQGAVLVDQGPPEARVGRLLARLGVRRLTALVQTHPQRDHIGGAADVLRRIPVGVVLDPRLRVGSPDEEAALREARRRRVRVVAARAGQVYRLGKLRLRVLWPDGPGPPGADPNLYAIVLLASYGAFDALLTADAESPVTLPLRPPAAELLKVAHHGSADDLLPSLLARVRPRVAVISVGAGNDYGHPAPSTLAALDAARGLDVFRTDVDGTVVVESDGHRLTVSEER